MVYKMRKKLLQLIEQQIQDKEYHGATLALFDQGKWQEYYIGTTDGKCPVKPGLVYDLASVSKVVGVGTICIFMINSGALDLDASLTKYYPSFHDDRVTLRQLLTHTSGLDPYIPNRDQLDAVQLKEAMNQLTVTSDKTFHYTDVNFLLLGFMLQEVTGKSLDQLFTEEVFEPFGMTKTTFGPRTEAVPTVNGVNDGGFMLQEVTGKSLDQLFTEEVFEPFGMTKTTFGPRTEAVPTVNGVNDGFVHDPKAKVLGNHAGSAGLFSTVKDLELFLNHYMEDDFAQNLFQNYSQQVKERSIAWRLEKGSAGLFSTVKDLELFLNHYMEDDFAQNLFQNYSQQVKERSIAWRLEKDNWLDHTGYTGPFIMFNNRKQAAVFLTNRTYDKDDRAHWIEVRDLVMQVIKDSFK